MADALFSGLCGVALMIMRGRSIERAGLPRPRMFGAPGFGLACLRWRNGPDRGLSAAEPLHRLRVKIRERVSSAPGGEAGVRGRRGNAGYDRALMPAARSRNAPFSR